MIIMKSQSETILQVFLNFKRIWYCHVLWRHWISFVKLSTLKNSPNLSTSSLYTRGIWKDLGPDEPTLEMQFEVTDWKHWRW